MARLRGFCPSPHYKATVILQDGGKSMASFATVFGAVIFVASLIAVARGTLKRAEIRARSGYHRSGR